MIRGEKGDWGRVRDEDTIEGKVFTRVYIDKFAYGILRTAAGFVGTLA